MTAATAWAMVGIGLAAASPDYADNGSYAGDINNDGIPGGITDVGKDVGEFAVRQDVETARHRATHVATAEPVMARAVRSHLGGEW